MKIIFCFLFLIMPVVSLADNLEDEGMTTVFEEHFDGWLYVHKSGMNATYEPSNKTYITAQNYYANGAAEGKANLPCLRLKSSYSFKVIIANNTRAHGNFLLSFKDFKNKMSVSLNGKKNLTKNSDGTYTIPVNEGAKTITIYFKNSSSETCCIDDIVLKAPTSTVRTSPSPELDFEQSEISIVTGTTCPSPVLSNPQNLPLKWYSSNQDVATVDDSGNVTSHFIGTTTIYALFEGNDSLAYKAASYKLTTRRDALKNEVYYDGFEDYHATGGNGGEFDAAQNAYNGDYNDADADFLISGLDSRVIKGYQCIMVEEIYNIKNLDFLGLKNGMLNFKFTWSYMSSKKPLTVTLKYSDDNIYERVFNISDYGWNDFSVPISYSSQLVSISFSGKAFFLDEISIISKDSITIGSTGYATFFCSGRALKVPAGVTANTMKVCNGKILNSHTYYEGETLPKSTAVVLNGLPGKYYIESSEDDGFIDDDNQLHGSDANTLTVGNDGDLFYLLADSYDGVGFYWGAENGAAFQNGAHKAYLVIPSSGDGTTMAKRNYVFNEDSTTGINNIERSMRKDSSAYGLDGKPITSGFKGIMIINGKKLIKR